MKILFSLFLILINACLQAQSIYNLSSTVQNVIGIAGTSTLHDWEMEVTEVSSSFQLSKNNAEVVIDQFKMSIPVVSFKSDKSKMEKNAKSALKSDSFDKIKFLSTKTTLLGDKIDEIYDGEIEGDLTISGVTKSVKVPFQIRKTKMSLQLQSMFKVSMLDYDITPPSLFFGMFKTDPDVTISFNLQYK